MLSSGVPCKPVYVIIVCRNIHIEWVSCIFCDTEPSELWFYYDNVSPRAYTKFLEIIKGSHVNKKGVSLFGFAKWEIN
jgi:hypothetical protein